ncbi:hypothetical protein BDV37DRAFT_183626 [Aspergillus pseudonomiae]|uniref:Uncharacterized protein n=1 Tax=Aspergillus pseudonomiae TaxID=1506151 RepID=A0A5N7D6E3_9EURO|nr:uncharacterized protein BDV37DRAFT_183626 [Aspergillus pseudonomiae]KAE8401348.1 hypothetical protein BDV37DRAFT_183626 [Aspergillus pseudonomiae]
MDVPSPVLGQVNPVRILLLPVGQQAGRENKSQSGGGAITAWLILCFPSYWENSAQGWDSDWRSSTTVGGEIDWDDPHEAQPPHLVLDPEPEHVSTSQAIIVLLLASSAYRGEVKSKASAYRSCNLPPILENGSETPLQRNRPKVKPSTTQHHQCENFGRNRTHGTAGSQTLTGP